MASDDRAGSNHLDQSSQSVSSATAAKSKGGRPPHPIKEEFIKVGSSANASKRATYDCKHCNTSFTEQQATNPNLIKHIVSECSQCPSETRQKWQLAHAGAQATSNSGETAVQAGVKRKRQTTLDSTIATQAHQLTKALKLAVDFHLLRWQPGSGGRVRRGGGHTAGDAGSTQQAVRGRPACAAGGACA